MAFSCPHCHQPVASEGAFCCAGCEGAYRLIHTLGLSRYYASRTLRDDAPPPTPQDMPDGASILPFAQQDAAGVWHLSLHIEGLHCAACVWLIEQMLAREADIAQARLNMTTRRLSLSWRGDKARAAELVALITRLGYTARPYDPSLEDTQMAAEQKFLLRCLAIAGFAAGNIMLISAALWSSTQSEMGIATRDLLHWVSALIAMPTILYAGQPFYRSALRALAHRRTNMDVPISLALIGATAMSLFETITHGEHAYFDSAVMLLFFLLIGRYLDRRARNRARGAAQDLLAVMSATATIMESGHARFLPARELEVGMELLVASGERIAADGVVSVGTSALDTSLITGETLPRDVSVGSPVFAGTINLDAPLRITVTATRESSLLAEMVRMMERAEQGNARYVRLADKVAHYYTPVVHLLGLVTFLYWLLIAHAPWQDALLIGITVLIITCPCALALAVPVVQVIASGRLFARGILLKSGDALERLAVIDHVVFDKTGTLTCGTPVLQAQENIPTHSLSLAASIAAASRHPLARALVRAASGVTPHPQVIEVQGQGMEAQIDEHTVRLGKRSFAAPHAADTQDGALEIWLGGDDVAAQRFTFHDPLRADATTTLHSLQGAHLGISLLSGDRQQAVEEAARACTIQRWKAEQTPAEKLHALETLRAQGQRTLMVGDGLNDAPALAAAYVSMSPSSALDITQNAADIVFQGEKLGAVVEAWRTARRAQTLVKQNIGFSMLYNVVAVPVAMAGYITPLLAALAMSGSSLVVIFNALRLNRR